MVYCSTKDAGENKISEFRNAETTSIKLQDRNEYPYNAKTVIQDYLDNIDEKIKRDYESVVAGDKKFKRNYINDVDSRQARDFKKLTGVDVEGYTNNINTNAYQHIYERHGNNGKHDTTMSKSEDVARMKYVIENYDKAELVANEDTGEIDYSTEFRDKNDNPAKLVKLSKQINGAHYVVITAADNKYKKLWVVSTYIKKRVTQALDVQAPRSNAQNALASPLNKSISQKSENDNDILNQDRNIFDSEGNELTKQQQEYFKDSKARDEDGNLQKVYHGTVSDFTIFDREFANIEGDWGKGYYFTTSESDVKRNYANEEGPDLKNKIELYAET